MNLRIIFIATLLLFSCEADNVNKETYFDNGQMREKYSVDLNGLKDGEFLSFYDNGQIEYKAFYKKGKKNGVVYKYYPDGELAFKMNFVEDLQHGETYYYSKDGILESMMALDMGRLKYVKIFYPSGKLKYLESHLDFNNNPLSESTINSLVRFSEQGKVEKGSRFGEYRFLSPDKLELDISSGFYYDSVIVCFKKNFKDNNFIREEIFTNLKDKKLVLKINESDYHKNRLNIQVRSKDNTIYYHDGIPLQPIFTYYYYQISKGEKPNKFNLDFIEN